MPRVAPLDSLQLCKISGCLYTPYVQDQWIFGFIDDQTPDITTTAMTSSMISSFGVPSKTLLGILGY
jgi:hypothetical protein